MMDHWVQCGQLELPSWSAGLGSYHWIELPSLQKHQDLQDDGELFVGHYEDSTIGETDQSSIIQ
jgi:hypothetical protein